MATKLKNNTVMLGEVLKDRVLVTPPNHVTDYLLGNSGVYSGKEIPQHVVNYREKRRKAEKEKNEPKTTAPNTFQTVLAPRRRKKKKPIKKAQNDEDFE